MIARLVLVQAGALGLVGLTIGSIGAVAAAHVLQSVLPQTTASNPAILFVTVVVMSAVIGVASYLPTRRAAVLIRLFPCARNNLPYREFRHPTAKVRTDAPGLLSPGGRRATQYCERSRSGLRNPGMQ
jgi:hypothetical protein